MKTKCLCKSCSKVAEPADLHPGTCRSRCLSPSLSRSIMYFGEPYVCVYIDIYINIYIHYLCISLVSLIKKGG